MHEPHRALIGLHERDREAYFEKDSCSAPGIRQSLAKQYRVRAGIGHRVNSDAIRSGKEGNVGIAMSFAKGKTKPDSVLWTVTKCQGAVSLSEAVVSPTRVPHHTIISGPGYHAKRLDFPVSMSHTGLLLVLALWGFSS
jgi:hypothetical protein